MTSQRIRFRIVDSDTRETLAACYSLHASTVEAALVGAQTNALLCYSLRCSRLGVPVAVIYPEDVAKLDDVRLYVEAGRDE